jgi:aryl-alcohol dehydrogenase-like predicted oxidoreductase
VDAARRSIGITETESGSYRFTSMDARSNAARTRDTTRRTSDSSASLHGADLAVEIAVRHPLIFGSAGWAEMSQTACAELLDLFVDCGGSVIDTARVYAGGRSEAAIGTWLHNRGRRDHTFVITKGGHPDWSGQQRLSASDIRDDVEHSLRTLGIDYVDLFLLHRDAPLLSVEELCDTLMAVQRCGLARYVGVSNWSSTRILEAATYLGGQCLGGLAAVSNYFGLAAPPPRPVLPGAASAHDRRLLREPDRPLMLAWGALTGGYFAREADPVGSYWDTRGNAVRRAALRHTAAEANVSATALLVRWLSELPRVRPVVGTTNLHHLEDMMIAAQDTTLDAAVDTMMERCAPDTDPDSGRFLLTSQRAAAW